MRLPADDPLREDLGEIHTAGERAAALTRQLLAFSRQQVLQPAVVDVNEVLTGMEKMLRRLIGEDIDLDVVWPPRSGTSASAPGQLEQVIMNLVVNARDAMPNGGKLTIETANVSSTSATPTNTWASPRGLRHARRDRHRHRHGQGDAGPDLRAVLHDQGARTKGPASACRPCTAS